MLKSIQLLLGVPVLPSVTSSTDLRDLFEAGVFQ